MSDIKIFVSHRIDSDSATIDNPLYHNVRCGAVFDERENVDMPGDNTGNNISERRETFNEFTVLYWAWKNVDSDYYGLCHYRRYMIFSKEKLSPDPYGNVLFDFLNSETANICGLLDKSFMQKTISKYDFIISDPYDVTYRGFKNLREHYKEVDTQHLEDLEKVVEVIEDICPEYLESVNEYFDGTLFYPCNLFIMKKAIFYEYCAWLFPILFELERRIDISNYDVIEKRVFGFLGERLLGAFYIHYLKKHPEVRHISLQRALFFDTQTEKKCKAKQFSFVSFVKQTIPKDSFLYRILKKIYNTFK